MRIFTSAEDHPGKKIQTSTATPATAAESPNAGTSELHTSLLKIPDVKKSDERPSKEVPEEIKVARIRPTSQGTRPKQRNSIAKESPHESTVRQGGYSRALFNRVNNLSCIASYATQFVKTSSVSV